MLRKFVIQILFPFYNLFCPGHISLGLKTKLGKQKQMDVEPTKFN
jgi:hypothetical protein